MYKIILLTVLFLPILTSAEEWGLTESWKADCNPATTFYHKTNYRWFLTRYQAEYYVEQNGKLNSPYLLLYREGEGKTIYLHAKITPIERSHNTSQTVLKGLPDYFVQELHKHKTHITEPTYI